MLSLAMEAVNGLNTDREVQDFLARVRKDPRTTNPRILQVQMTIAARGKNGGFPHDMYHDSLSPVTVQNVEEEMIMSQAGFYSEYRHRSFPVTLFRRNMHPRFEKSPEERQRIQALTPEARAIEMATVNEHDYIEECLVHTQAELDAKLAIPARKGVTSAWVRKFAEVEPFEQPSNEDPALAIARLEGQLAEARAKAEESRGRRGSAA
jgi:hypothetical protein